MQDANRGRNDPRRVDNLQLKSEKDRWHGQSIQLAWIDEDRVRKPSRGSLTCRRNDYGDRNAIQAGIRLEDHRRSFAALNMPCATGTRKVHPDDFTALQNELFLRKSVLEGPKRRSC